MAEKAVKLPEKEELTPVQKLARLDAERAEILASAKADALKKANDAVGELNSLGFAYELTERSAATSRGDASGVCSVCGFATVKPHDARSHRGQDPKRPFTDQELKDRNLIRA